MSFTKYSSFLEAQLFLDNIQLIFIPQIKISTTHLPLILSIELYGERKKIPFTILESYHNKIQKKGFLYIIISFINKLLKYPDLTTQYIYYPFKLASRWPQGGLKVASRWPRGGFLKGPDIKLVFPWIYSKFWTKFTNPTKWIVGPLRRASQSKSSFC